MAFIDELISPFICKSTNKEHFTFGHFFWAPVYFPHQKPEFWRPKSVNQQLHVAKDFNIVTGASDLFKKGLPYSDPHLATNEEFMAVRAKMRPGILLQPPDPSLAKQFKVPMGINLERRLCVVAPLFSLENAEGYSRVSDEFLSRVRKLEYPQFSFLGKSGPLTKDSLVRLDELQSIAAVHLAASGFELSPDAMSLFRSLSHQHFHNWAVNSHLVPAIQSAHDNRDHWHPRI